MSIKTQIEELITDDFSDLSDGEILDYYIDLGLDKSLSDAEKLRLFSELTTAVMAQGER